MSNIDLFAYCSLVVGDSRVVLSSSLWELKSAPIVLCWVGGGCLRDGEDRSFGPVTQKLLDWNPDVNSIISSSEQR